MPSDGSAAVHKLTREGICVSPSKALEAAQADAEYKVLPVPLNSAQRTPVYKTVHKAGSLAVESQLFVRRGGRTRYLIRPGRIGIVHLRSCNEPWPRTGRTPQSDGRLRVNLTLADPLVFSIVREPIGRFVSAYNTLLSTETTRARRRTVGQNWARPSTDAECHERLAAFVHGIFSYDEAAARRYRYDQHTATQLNELRCSLSGPKRLTFVAKLEALRSRSGTLSSEHLPSYSIGIAHQHLGGSLPCAIERANLTDAMIQQLCVYYAQDFVCLGYELPPECSPAKATNLPRGRTS